MGGLGGTENPSLSSSCRQSLVLCERDWGAQEIRRLNAGFKVLSAAEIIDDPWLS